MNRKDFVSELSKLRPSSTFLSLWGYRSAHGELADFSIIFHISYKNALEKSVQALSNYTPTNALETVARQELLDGYNKSLEKMATTAIEDVDDNYVRFFDENDQYIKGIKLHRETGQLHMYGMLNHKRVLLPGDYPKRNKKELTKAKDALRKMCPVDKFRQFIIDASHVQRISVEHLSLLPPNV